MKDGLGKKLGPLPVWAWAALGLVVIGVVYLTRPKGGDAASASGSDTPAPDTTGQALTSDSSPASGISAEQLAALLQNNGQALQQLLSTIVGATSPASTGESVQPPVGTGSQVDTVSGPGTSTQTDQTVAEIDPSPYTTSVGFYTLPHPYGGMTVTGPGGPVIDVDQGVAIGATGFGAAGAPSAPVATPVFPHGLITD